MPGCGPFHCPPLRCCGPTRDRATKQPHLRLLPLRFAFKAKFIKKHGLKQCCNRPMCLKTTGSGVCKMHFAFRLPDFVLPPSGLSNDSTPPKRREHEIRIEARKARKQDAVAYDKEQADLRASKRASRACRFHHLGKCQSVVQGCEYDHEGKNPADIPCSSTTGKKCKIQDCPYKGHTDIA